MSKLSRDDILKLAALSKLRLSDGEIEKLQTELSEILDYVKQLDEADTADLQPTYQVSGLINVYRDDEPKGYGYETGELLKNAPDVQDGQFKVKRVL